MNSITFSATNEQKQGLKKKCQGVAYSKVLRWLIMAFLNDWVKLDDLREAFGANND